AAARPGPRRLWPEDAPGAPVRAVLARRTRPDPRHGLAQPRGPSADGQGSGRGHGPDPAVRRGGRDRRGGYHRSPWGGAPDEFGHVLDLLGAAAPVIAARLARRLKSTPTE